jgi:hypothetical protein
MFNLGIKFVRRAHAGSRYILWTIGFNDGRILTHDGHQFPNQWYIEKVYPGFELLP